MDKQVEKRPQHHKDSTPRGEALQGWTEAVPPAAASMEDTSTAASMPRPQRTTPCGPAFSLQRPGPEPVRCATAGRAPVPFDAAAAQLFPQH